jgi:hypothetical protein
VWAQAKKVFRIRTGMNLRLMAWTVAAAAALTSSAHPGHAPFSEGTKHFITSPSHLGVVLLACAALFAGAQFLKTRPQRAVAGAVATLIAIAAVVF